MLQIAVNVFPYAKLAGSCWMMGKELILSNVVRTCISGFKGIHLLRLHSVSIGVCYILYIQTDFSEGIIEVVKNMVRRTEHVHFKREINT